MIEKMIQEMQSQVQKIRIKNELLERQMKRTENRLSNARARNQTKLDELRAYCKRKEKPSM